LDSNPHQSVISCQVFVLYIFNHGLSWWSRSLIQKISNDKFLKWVKNCFLHAIIFYRHLDIFKYLNESFTSGHFKRRQNLGSKSVASKVLHFSLAVDHEWLSSVTKKQFSSIELKGGWQTAWSRTVFRSWTYFASRFLIWSELRWLGAASFLASEIKI